MSHGNTDFIFLYSNCIKLFLQIISANYFCKLFLQIISVFYLLKKELCSENILELSYKIVTGFKQHLNEIIFLHSAIHIKLTIHFSLENKPYTVISRV